MSRPSNARGLVNGPGMSLNDSTDDARQGATARRRIVAVLAHPDDETFIIGGALALYASRGHDVHVVYGPFGPEPDGKPAPQRLAELESAAKTLGITTHTFLPFLPLPQGEGPGEGALPHLTNAIRAELRRLQPHAVITFDATGATGNLDHILTGAATLQAVGSMTGDATPRLYAAVFARRQLAARLNIAKLTRRKDLNDLRDALKIAQQSQRPTTMIDVRSVLAQRLEAAKCYTTALAEGAWWMRRWELLPPRIRRRLAPRELYARLIPPPSPSEDIEHGLFGEE